MSSILPVGSTSTYAYGGTSAPTDIQSVLGGIAGQLSMSPTDLQSALKSGESLTDIASKKGISSDQLIQAVSQQIQQQRDSSGQQPLDSQALSQAANKIVSGHRHGHHRHGGGTPPPASSTSDSATQTSSIWLSSGSSSSGSPGSNLDLLA